VGGLPGGLRLYYSFTYKIKGNFFNGCRIYVELFGNRQTTEGGIAAGKLFNLHDLSVNAAPPLAGRGSKKPKKTGGISNETRSSFDFNHGHSSFSHYIAGYGTSFRTKFS
jgi:hypothetical protein